MPIGALSTDDLLIGRIQPNVRIYAADEAERFNKLIQWTQSVSNLAVSRDSVQTIHARKTFTAGIDMNGTEILNVGNPQSGMSACNKDYVDNRAPRNFQIVAVSCEVAFPGSGDKKYLIQASRVSITPRTIPAYIRYNVCLYIWGVSSSPGTLSLKVLRNNQASSPLSDKLIPTIQPLAFSFIEHITAGGVYQYELEGNFSNYGSRWGFVGQVSLEEL